MGSIIDGSRVVPCHYCQREVGPGALPFTRDHVVPRAMGGRDRRDNVVPACRDCNGDKADKYPTHDCSFCNRTRRRHWEEFGITDQTKNRKRAHPSKRKREAVKSASSTFEAAQEEELRQNRIANARAANGRAEVARRNRAKSAMSAPVGTKREGFVKTSDGWILERLA